MDTTKDAESQVFRIEGFRNPSVAESERQAREAEEAIPLDMSTHGVLSEARRRTQLDDFGPMDFVERLEVLLRDVSSDTNVWRGAKDRFRESCVKAASNRLKNQHFLGLHPSTKEVKIDRPIIIVGLSRSGTTHLENLLASDRRLRHLPVYLGSEAVPTPGEAAGPDGIDPRWARSNAHWLQMKENAAMVAMHEHSPDHACGENELQMPDFASHQWEWMADVPAWRDYLLSHDQTPHYRYGKAMLQAIAHQLPSDRRWILKGNQHSEQLPALMQVYPDAFIVQTHRDPLAIIQSVLTMRGLVVLGSQKNPDIPRHVAYWVDRIERILRAYMRDMHVVPEHQRYDLMFQDVMADDVGTAQKVLEFAGLPSTAESIEDMANYMADHPRGKNGRVIYDMVGDFNLDIGQLRERFRFYTDVFPVREEVKA